MTSARFLLLLAALSAAPAAHAFTVESDPDAARPPYASLELPPQAEVQDPADDPVVFDPEGREVFPPYVPDIRSVAMRSNRKFWTIVLRMAQAVPPRPRWPLRVGVHVDRADTPDPPAAPGLGKGADITCEARRIRGTQWDTTCRYFEPGVGKWQDGGSIATEVDGDAVTLFFPLEILPARGASIRFSASAMSGAQLRSLDVLPGEGLPLAPLAPEQEVSRSLRSSAWAPYALGAAVLLAAGAGVFLLRRE